MRKTVDRHIRFDEATAELMRKRSAELHIKDSEYVRRLIRQDSYQMDREILKDMIRDMIPDRIAITEGSEGTARQLRRVLQKNELLNEQGEGRVILQTSGTEKDILLMRKLLETDKMGR